MTDVIYELKNKLEYAYKGDTRQASSVFLFEPTPKHLKNFAPVKQAFTQAVASTQSNLSDDDKEKIKDSSEEANDDSTSTVSSSECINLMYSCPDIDMNKIFLYCQQLFSSGLAKIDGEENLTASKFEDLSLKDMENLCGEFIANFIAAPLMNG